MSPDGRHVEVVVTELGQLSAQLDGAPEGMIAPMVGTVGEGGGQVRRLLAMGGLVGPATFVAAWSTGGARLAGYSPVEDAISRLATVGAPTRPLMTVGFVVFGVSVPLFAVPLRHWVGGRSWMSATATGVATLGVAATPLDSGVDALHGAFASIGYLTLAATPLLAARPLGRSGRRGWRRYSLGTGVVSAVALAATATGRASGLSQRIGLTVVDLWLAAAALAMMGRTNRGT